jgi:hypothetical protein
VPECDREVSTVRTPRPTRGCYAIGEKKLFVFQETYRALVTNTVTNTCQPCRDNYSLHIIIRNLSYTSVIWCNVNFPQLLFLFVVLPSSTCLFTVGVEGFCFHLITLKHTPRSVVLLWTRDRPVAETSA